MRRRLLGLCAGVASTVTACFGTPTPLAPTISGSVGVPHHGVQTNGVELPRHGDGFRRYRPYGRHHFGNPRLVQALQAAAAAVAEQFGGGPPLLLGDLSSESGGKIPRHRSHRTGRDVDLLWYVTTPAGAPVENPGFVRIGADSLAALQDGGHVRLDVEREWALIKHLLTSDAIDVQWMFCSREIEALVIQYARARGEPAELVWHAETVLLQPGDSLAHDDHIHMRIACSPQEAILGCQGGGPYWEWLPPLPRFEMGDEWIYAVTSADPFEEPDEPERSVDATPGAGRKLTEPEDDGPQPTG